METVEVTVPAVGESITEVLISNWLAAEGGAVTEDEPVVVLETDKVTVELPAPASGVLHAILKAGGETASVGEVIARIAVGAPAAVTVPPVEPNGEDEIRAPAPATSPPAGRGAPAHVMPAAERLLQEHGLSATEVTASGPGGRLLKEDIQRHLAAARSTPSAPAASPPRAPTAPEMRHEEIVPMTPFRRRVAERLVQSQQTAALLTTFNEIDMSAVIRLRKEHQDAFRDKHGIKLGFMSFFVKAVIEALKLVPELNAEVREQSILYRNYYDIGIAVGGGRGLVVPVIRNAERLGFGAIEQTIADFGARAQENRLTLEELQGGTFTISNGGIYGSLLSTPIVNPPQSGVLGLHAIQDRPVARGGQVEIRPMMYVALTYDHRIVDGREAVTFLKQVKHCLEEPARILLEV